MYFGVSSLSWKATRDYIILYNNVGLVSYGCRRCSVRKPWKSTFSITPLLFDASSPRNLREYPHKVYIARNYSYCATSLPLIVWVYLYSNVRGGLRKTHVFWNVVRNGLQGHPRSILAPIESAYATSYWPSIVTLVLSFPISEILQDFFQNSASIPIPPEFCGCCPWTRLRMLWLRGATTLS